MEKSQKDACKKIVQRQNDKMPMARIVFEASWDTANS